MRTLGADRWQTFRLTELPAALPAALSGARIAVAIAVFGALLAGSRDFVAGMQTSMLIAAAVLLAAATAAAFLSTREQSA